MPSRYSQASLISGCNESLNVQWGLKQRRASVCSLHASLMSSAHKSRTILLLRTNYRSREIQDQDQLNYLLSPSGIRVLRPHTTSVNMAPSQLPSIFNATSQDIEMLVAAQCHIGSKNLQVHMEPYLWKTRPDGINVINIGKTWYGTHSCNRVAS